MLRHQATGEYMVDYDGFASLDLDSMKWFAKLYCLCSDPAIEVAELVIRKQHIKPLPFPEVEIFETRKRGGRGGGGRGGRGGRRGRGRGAAPPAADGAAGPLEDDKPFSSDDDAGSGGGGGGESLNSSDRDDGDSPVLSSEDVASDVAEKSSLIDSDLEACVSHALTSSVFNHNMAGTRSEGDCAGAAGVPGHGALRLMGVCWPCRWLRRACQAIVRLASGYPIRDGLGDSLVRVGSCLGAA